MNRYTYGIVLGVTLSVGVYLSNIAFPSAFSDTGSEMAAIYLAVFFLIALGAFVTTKKFDGWTDGAVNGAIIAFIAVGLTMATFFIIDNFFLDIISEQPDKIFGFSHQHLFTNMRDYVNDGLIKGLAVGLPVASISGALLGTVGSAVHKIADFRHDN